MQDIRQIAKFCKADSFLTFTEIRSQMTADYGINMSVHNAITRHIHKRPNF